MSYLILYLITGVSVALVMALIQLRSKDAWLASQADGRSRPLSFGVYAFVALAWPISIAAFVYGLALHLTGARQQQ
jgi:hypothetical protein